MFVGIDVGGTKIKHGLIDEQGAVFEKDLLATNHDQAEFLKDLHKIVLSYQQAGHQLQGVGISAPGIIQRDGFMLTAGAIKSLYGINLKKEIEARTGLPVMVENDANAVAIAEMWVGNAQSYDNYLSLVLGTGIGGGIVINRQVFQGAHGMAGEFGWMMIDQLPLDEDLETVSLNQRAAVVGGLVNQYQIALHKQKSSTEKMIDAKDIFFLAKAGDQLATSVLDRFYQDLAVGLLNLIACFDPEAILIGGAISENQEFFSSLQHTINRLIDQHKSLAYLKDKTLGPIIPAKLRNDAGMIGAVYQVSQALNQGLLIK